MSANIIFHIEPGQEELCTTLLLGKPLLGEILRSMGHKEEPVFLFHSEDSEIADEIHRIDDSIYCIPLSSTVLSDRIAEGLQKSEKYRLVDRIVFGSLDYIFTVPVLPYLPEGNCILTHSASAPPFCLKVEDGRVLEMQEEGPTGSVIQFAKASICRSLCEEETANTWKELVASWLEEDFQESPKAAEEVIEIATDDRRKEYESYVHSFVFSLDGVVVSFAMLQFQAWAKTLSAFHIILTQDLYISHIINRSQQEIAKSFGVSVSQIKESYAAAWKDGIENGPYSIVRGLNNMVAMVLRKGHRVSIISHISKEETETICSTLQIPMEYVVYSMPISHPLDRTILFVATRDAIKDAPAVKWLAGCPSYMSADALVEAGVHVVIQDFETPEEIITALTQSAHVESQNTTDLEGMYTKSIRALFPNAALTYSVDAMRGNLSTLIPVRVDTMACVAKIQGPDSKQGVIANQLGVRERETNFYDTVARYVPVRVPKYYGHLKSQNWETMGILLEDVRESNLINLSMETASIDVVLSVVSEMAQLHAKFWGQPLAGLSVRPLSLPFTVVEEAWPFFKARWETMLEARDWEALCSCKKDFQETSETLSKGPQTLLHGDIKSANLYFDSKTQRPGFLDWQFTAEGKGVQDLVFFMIESFGIEKMQQYREIIKQYYYTKLLEFGVSYTWSEYSSDFAAAVRYLPFFVAVWYGSMESADLPDPNFPFFYLQRFTRFLRDTQ